jgi:predicted GNAT superfamily acetyltransferase
LRPASPGQYLGAWYGETGVLNGTRGIAMAYTLKLLETHDDYHDCEDIQKEAWGFCADLDIIPLTLLVTTQLHGGLVLGAFDEAGVQQGFCYGILGLEAGRLVHCSHMLAVRKAARGKGLGALLKWGQRDEVLAQGIDLMLWTYDPLESLNACLNFHKLGGLSDEYILDLYGQTTSELHAGMATDRLHLKWYLNSPRVAAHAAGDRGTVAAALAAGELDVPWVLEGEGSGDAMRPGELRLGLDAPRISCEIPPSIQAIKVADLGTAIAWREVTRKLFTSYLEAGYFVRECVRTHDDPPRIVYLLEKGTIEPTGLEE